LFTLMIIDRNTGVSIHSHYFTEKELDTDLVGGFLTAIQSFGMEISEKDTKMKRLAYEHFEIELKTGKFITVALITQGYPDKLTLKRVDDFLDTFEKKYENELENFVGNLTPFEGVAKLVQDTFLGE
ncbi:MAG: hypothetical protein ACXQS8_00905, partial [Candidatus Helarchaeales archaeon]